MLNFLTFQVYEALFIPIYLFYPPVLYLSNFSKISKKSGGKSPLKNNLLPLSG